MMKTNREDEELFNSLDEIIFPNIDEIDGIAISFPEKLTQKMALPILQEPLGGFVIWS